MKIIKTLATLGLAFGLSACSGNDHENRFQTSCEKIATSSNDFSPTEGAEFCSCMFTSFDTYVDEETMEKIIGVFEDSPSARDFEDNIEEALDRSTLEKLGELADKCEA